MGGEMNVESERNAAMGMWLLADGANAIVVRKWATVPLSVRETACGKTMAAWNP